MKARCLANCSDVTGMTSVAWVSAHSFKERHSSTVVGKRIRGFRVIDVSAGVDEAVGGAASSAAVAAIPMVFAWVIFALVDFSHGVGSEKEFEISPPILRLAGQEWTSRYSLESTADRFQTVLSDARHAGAAILLTTQNNQPTTRRPASRGTGHA